jgi:hypothetical protein
MHHRGHTIYGHVMCDQVMRALQLFKLAVNVTDSVTVHDLYRLLIVRSL